MRKKVKKYFLKKKTPNPVKELKTKNQKVKIIV